jgi:hypothetical protein
MKVTGQHIKELFQKCESAFETCWNTLLRLKEPYAGDDHLATDIVLFQEVLAQPLFELQQIRNQISAWERILIAYKQRYKPDWFRKQMRCLSNYKIGIDQVRNIGKGLGDAFTYYFYRNDLDLLEKQFTHQRIDSTIGGTGLLGELQFLKSIKHLDGNFPLYHGITNTLRYGDFSFYDLKKNKITEIGELKTKKIGEDQYELLLTVVSTQPNAQLVEERSIQAAGIERATAERLRKQVDAIVKILSPDKNPFTFGVNVSSGLFVEQVQQLHGGSKVNQHNLLKASPGLLYAGIRLSKACLFTRIFNRKVTGITTKIDDNLLKEVRGILKSGTQDNAIILGNLLYYPDYNDKNAPGTIPLFWYPLSPSLLKDLYFLNFIVTTLFNPVHIIDDLKQRGYHIESKYNTEPYAIGRAQLKYFDSMITLITNHLHTEQSVLGMIDTAMDINSKKGNFKQVLIKPYMNFSV